MFLFPGNYFKRIRGFGYIKFGRIITTSIMLLAHKNRCFGTNGNKPESTK